MATRAPTPPFRRLRVYAFDPSASTDLDTAVINEAVVKLPWETLEPGPCGDYLDVIDHDPASGCFYAPVDLDDPFLLAQDGHPPSEANPQFHQQMVYAVAMLTIRNFERALGRRVLWRQPSGERQRGDDDYIGQLRIYPHALREANAYYSPAKRALLFGYFRASTTQPGRNLPGGAVFTCLSHDIVAHETTHAILDGLNRRFIEGSNRDTLALHEGFSDIVALFQHFTLPDALRHQIAHSRGDLGGRTLLSELATQFGQAIGGHGALRSAIDDVDLVTKEPDPGKLATTLEPHDRGAILVAAVFDAFVTIYRARIADLLRLATGSGNVYPDRDLHPDLANRLTSEANKAAGHVLRMCIRALDYLPPVDVTFGDFLRALVTADEDLVKDDPLGYRVAMIEAFRRRGIYPDDCRSLAADSLRWREPDEPITIDWLGRCDFSPGTGSDRQQIAKRGENNARKLWGWLTEHAELEHGQLRNLGLWLKSDAPMSITRSRRTGGPAVEVHSVRIARRAGPDGEQLPQVVVQITQRRCGYRTAALQRERDQSGPQSGESSDFMFRGGCTLIVDLQEGAVRYAITKDIASATRLERQRAFLFDGAPMPAGACYFNRHRSQEPFAFLHRRL